MGQQSLARFGGYGTPSGAMKQDLPEFDFKQSNLPTQDGLRDMGEVLQLPKIRGGIVIAGCDNC